MRVSRRAASACRNLPARRYLVTVRDLRTGAAREAAVVAPSDEAARDAALRRLYRADAAWWSDGADASVGHVCRPLERRCELLTGRVRVDVAEATRSPPCSSPR